MTVPEAYEAYKKDKGRDPTPSALRAWMGRRGYGWPKAATIERELAVYVAPSRDYPNLNYAKHAEDPRDGLYRGSSKSPDLPEDVVEQQALEWLNKPGKSVFEVFKPQSAELTPPKGDVHPNYTANSNFGTPNVILDHHTRKSQEWVDSVALGMLEGVSGRWITWRVFSLALASTLLKAVAANSQMFCTSGVSPGTV